MILSRVQHVIYLFSALLNVIDQLAGTLTQYKVKFREKNNFASEGINLKIRCD